MKHALFIVKQIWVSYAWRIYKGKPCFEDSSGITAYDWDEFLALVKRARPHLWAHMPTELDRLKIVPVPLYQYSSESGAKPVQIK